MNPLLYDKISAILGAVVVHLLLAIIFVTIKITSLKINNEQYLAIDLQLPSIEQEEQKAEEKKKSLEDLADQFISGAQSRNIGVNVSEKLKSEISTENYIKQLQDELNAGRPQSDHQQVEEESGPNQEKITSELKPPIENAVKTGFYKGPTNIYYDLPGRYDTHLSVPVYKCEGNGKVVVEIIVTQKGEVISAGINRTASEQNECLINAAYKAALRTKFNLDYTKAPARQKGTITYLFVAQ